jgi:hypothetical protein
MILKVGLSIAALVVFIGAGFSLLAFTGGSQFVKETFTEVTQSLENHIDVPLKEVTPEAVKESLGSTTIPIPEAGIPLRDLQIEAAQEKAIEAVGIDPATFVITKDMLVCAQETLGPERVGVIIAGESPTIVEMGKLFPCLKAN